MGAGHLTRPLPSRRRLALRPGGHQRSQPVRDSWVPPQQPGNTVIVIEHHQAVMAPADWLIDLGPGAGQDGGRVVFTGTPADLVSSGNSLTAQHLRAYLRG